MGVFNRFLSIQAIMNYLALSVVCFATLATSSIMVPKSSNRQLGFCCGDVATKCAVGCAGKDCSIQCSGTCGIFGTTCSYTCSQVTNACSATTTTTAATTTTTAATTTTTGATTTTTAACIATGSLCLSITEGSKGTCCSGADGCSSFVSGTGYNCA